MKSNVTLVVGAILLAVCIASLTVLAALHVVDAAQLTHMVAVVVGGVLGAYQAQATANGAATPTAVTPVPPPPAVKP